MRLLKYEHAYILGSAVILALVIGSLLILRDSRTVIVTRTEKGFEPSRIVLKKGDSITFRSDVVEFWPASDSHPTHGLYPEFDPGRSLSPEEEWIFTFERAGVWTFHDHLSPQMRGKILVEGFPGEAVSECLKVTEHTTKAFCWEADVVSLLESSNIEDIFSTVHAWYEEDPIFRQNCHDVMHVLGTAAYEEYAESDIVYSRPETLYCGYGFYHGFIETMFVNRGNNQFEDVLQYCGRLGQRKGYMNTEGSCIHGIGHAVFDSLPGSLWGDARRMTVTSLRVCESLFTEEKKRKNCASGVFNALANALSAHEYDISYSDGTVAICEEQQEQYQAACYLEVGNGYVQHAMRGWEQTAIFLDSLKAKPRQHIIQGYAETKVRRTLGAVDLSYYKELCMRLTVFAEKEACVSGILFGFFGVGLPGKEYLEMIDFCSILNEAALQSYCFVRIAGRYSREQDFVQACEAKARQIALPKAQCTHTSIIW